MKKNLLILLLVSVFIVTSCNWQVPQKVSVKTQANYELSLGDSLFKLMDTDSLFGDFDIKSSIMNGISFNNSQVYDYFPGQADDTLQQFLIKIPIQEIPLNFSSYISGGDFSTAMENVSIDETTIQVPEMGDTKANASVNVDSLNSALSALLTASGSVVNGISSSLNYQTSTLGSFATMKISSGSYIISGAFESGTYVTITNNKGSASGYFGSNGKASIDVSGFEFDQYTNIVIYGNGSYVAYANTDSFSISKATGVTTVNPIEVEMNPCTFKVLSEESSSDFRSAVIGEGAISVSMNHDSSWTGITSTYKIALSGSLTLAERETDGLVDLANSTITGTNPTTLNSKLCLNLNNSTLDFSKASSLAVVAENEIKYFSSVTVGYDDSVASNDKNDFPDSFMDTVKRIYLLSSGVEGTYTNTLPEGNPITMSLTSDFLGVEKTAVLESDTESDTYSMMSGITSALERVIGSSENNSGLYDGIDFNVSIKLPGATDQNPDQIVLKNVKPGDSYKIAVNINPVVDYEKLVIDTSDYSNEGTQEIGLNLRSLFSALTFGEINMGDKLEFYSLPLYLLAVKPTYNDASGNDMFANAKFTGTINLFMGKDGAVMNDTAGSPANLDMLGEGTTAGTLAFTDMPDLEADENKLVTIDFDKEMKTKNQGNEVIAKDLATLLNKKFSDDEVSLYLKYNMSFSNGASGNSEMEIYKSQLDSSDVSSIAVMAFIAVPLKFNLTSDLDLPLIENQNSAESSETSDEGITSDSDEEGMEFLEVLDSAYMSIVPTALPFYSNPPMSLSFGITSDLKETLTLKLNEESKFDINKTKFKSMMSSMSGGSGFTPELSIQMKQGTISLPRNINFDANIILGLITDGTITVYPEISFGGN